MIGKYIVFKREEWKEFNPSHSSLTPKQFEEMFEIYDAVVIRRQDVFAPPALDAYANAIVTVATVLSQEGLTEQAAKLQLVADYFHEQATLAWETKRKMPD